MTQTEALKLALEALENLIPIGERTATLQTKAITAIKEALAQPKQDKERCVGCEACIDTACGRDECPKGWPKAAQPEQEPVAWRWPYKFKDIGETGAYEYHSHEFACLTHLPKGEPLYTHPPVPTAQPKEPEQEPVAQWLEDAFREGWASCRDAEFVGEDEEDWQFGNSTANSRMIDLQQSTPPQRKPLTDEQRNEIARQADENDWHDYDIIDAVEAAHGIKGDA